MKRVDVASALVKDDNGNILIVKNKKGDSYYWGLPGGAAEDGETLEQALIREVKEETGFIIVISGLNSVREMFFAEAGHHALIVTFYAKIVGGKIDINDPDNDIIEVKWANIEMVKELMPSLFEMLRINSDNDKALAFYAFEGVK
ncbi:NUDIX hydrolase [Paenibacillus sp. MBLB4367]|uniref:NUDIX hydrolase n=1 Tax=Paenibacillus sp. MBLB4367 TaxID=3384767 RepID=UPI0039083538